MLSAPSKFRDINAFMSESTHEMAVEDLTLEELRPVLAEAILNHVPFDGWSESALSHAAADLGIPAERARLVFPEGAIDMVDAYTALADARMATRLAALDLPAMKIRERIRTAVQVRLEEALPHREAVRRALSVLALPQNAARAAKTLWRTADAMWRAAGDTATDFNYYTKRMTLGGVYSATLLVWLDDTSEGLADTWGFLDRRIENIMQFEKAKARVKTATANAPSLVRFLGRLRYPAF